MTEKAGPFTESVQADDRELVGLRRDRWRRIWRSGLVIDVAATAILGTAVFVLGFGGGLRRLGGPLGSGDLVPGYAVVDAWSKGHLSGSTAFGFPFGMELGYFPATDYTQNAMAAILTAVTHNQYVGLNAVFAISFPLAALAALWVFRLVGVRGPIAVFAALAFTAIPFHWLRLEHLYLATMYSAVLGVGLALQVGVGAIDRMYERRGRWVALGYVGVLSAVIAASGIYYAFFTAMMCSVALIYRLAHRWSWRGAVRSTVPAVAVAGMLVAALMPAYLFQRAHPALVPLAHREAIESVLYSGSLAFALIPAPMTQLPLLRDLNPSIEHALSTAIASHTTGVFWYADFGSTFSLIALAFAALGLFWSVRRTAARRDSADQADHASRSSHDVSFGLIGILLAATVLFFVPWGLNVLFAALVTPEIRAWDRLVPIMLLLFFVGAMAAWRTLRLPQRGARVSIVAAVSLVLLVFDSVVPYQSGFAAAAAEGQAIRAAGLQYAAAVNAAIPGTCGILELPYLGYPEEPSLRDLPSYAPFWPGLTNPAKEWSFGAMKQTRDSQWAAALGAAIDPAAVANLVAGGFCGIHVDRRGLTADEESALSARLTDLLGPPVATGYGGNWTMYALPTSSVKALDVSEPGGLPATVAHFYYPATIAPRPSDTSVGSESDVDGLWWRGTSARTLLDITAPNPSVDFSEVSGTLVAGPCLPRDVTVSLDGSVGAVTTSVHLDAGASTAFTLTLPGKVSSARLVLTTTGAACTSPDQVVSTVSLHHARTA